MGETSPRFMPLTDAELDAALPFRPGASWMTYPRRVSSESEHELEPLVPHVWEMIFALLLFSGVAAVAVLIAVLLSRRVRR